MTHLTLTILSLCLGYTQAGMYVFGMGCILWEIISKMTSSGLSKDFLILQLFGFSYMAFQDQFGFWAPESSYSTEVHVSDLCISFIGLTWICLCMAAVHVVPQDQNNKNNTWTWMGWAPCAASVLTIVIVILTGGELDSTCIVMGTLKSAFSLVSYIPQFWLTYKNKSTRGYAMGGAVMDATSSSVGMLTVIVDYCDHDMGQNFFKSLNYGKFLMNLFSFLCMQQWFFLHFVVYPPKKDNVPLEPMLSGATSTLRDGKGDITLASTEFTSTTNGLQFLDSVVGNFTERIKKFVSR